MSHPDDKHWMQLALKQAEKAIEAGEVPVGAVLVKDNACLAMGFNQPIQLSDPSAHAEIQCLRAGALHLKNYRLPGTTLYVTLEPCSMCAGAIVHARVQRVVYATTDPRAGAVESAFQFFDNAALNHRVEYQGGLLAAEASQLLKDFFKARR